MQFGCLLPFLIIFNLFFGWMLLRPLYWALLELGLILAFILTSVIIVKRITGFSSRQEPGTGRIRRRKSPGPDGTPPYRIGRCAAFCSGNWASVRPVAKMRGEVIDVEGEQIKPKDKKDIE